MLFCLTRICRYAISIFVVVHALYAMLRVCQLYGIRRQSVYTIKSHWTIYMCSNDSCHSEWPQRYSCSSLLTSDCARWPRVAARTTDHRHQTNADERRRTCTQDVKEKRRTDDAQHSPEDRCKIIIINITGIQSQKDDFHSI